MKPTINQKVYVKLYGVKILATVTAIYPDFIKVKMPDGSKISVNERDLMEAKVIQSMPDITQNNKQEKMKVKIKRLHENAVIPKYSHIGDAGMDLTAISQQMQYGDTTYQFGLSIEIPDGYVGLIFPRSSIRNKNQMLSNSVAVIDSNFRGEISAVFKDIGDDETKDFYATGDRIAQLIILPYPTIEFEEVEELSESERGANGYGSTGR